MEFPQLDPGKPLIICDADEVLFLFVQGLENFLNRRGLYLDLVSFALTGNIKDRATDRPAAADEVKGLLGEFFASDAGDLEPAPGAAAALAELAEFAQIIVLSNLPATAAGKRAECLKAHGMDYPVIANEGAKGAAVARLAGMVNAPVIFIDDLPPHHRSVKEQAPEVIRLQMVADPRLRALIEAPGDVARHDDWPSALAFIRQALRLGP